MGATNLKPRVTLAEAQQRKPLALVQSKSAKIQRAADDIFAALEVYIGRRITPLAKKISELEARLMMIEHRDE